MRRLLFLTAVTTALMFGATNSSAATKPDITVTPFLQNVRLDSEVSKNLEIIYTNDSDKPKELALSVADFGSLDKTGGVAFSGSESSKLLDKYKLSKWIDLTDAKIKLQPHEKRTVTATINNDPSMAPGGHYASIIATVVNEQGNKKSEVSLKPKLSSLIFAVKTGGEKYDLSLQNIEPNGGVFSLPTEVELTMKSTGTVHVVPRGLVYLKDKSGKTLAKGAINQESGIVLPETNRIFNVKLMKMASTSLLKSSFYIQVDYRYDGINEFASKKYPVRYIDKALIVAILAVFSLLLLGFKKRKKNTNKKSE